MSSIFRLRRQSFTDQRRHPLVRDRPWPPGTQFVVKALQSLFKKALAP
jgi:hypothetical protein